MVKERVPMAWRAFDDYVLQGMRLTRGEIEVVKQLLSGDAEVLKNLEEFMPNKRERVEFAEKTRPVRYTGTVGHFWPIASSAQPIRNRLIAAPNSPSERSFGAEN